MRYTIAATLLTLALGARHLPAQQPQGGLMRRSMEGPRLGVTFVTGSRADARLREYGVNPFMSQFGWHFEQDVSPASSGPEFVVEEVLLLGAVEQNTLVPSATLLMGIRLPRGFEFGIGPNVSPLGSGLALGIGQTLTYGDVRLPINLAVVRSPGALRTTLLLGYAIQRPN